MTTTTIINASAGSGKTYQLAVAYLRALLQPLPDGTPTSPQQVLATTFTRAAASEILERVLLRLSEAVLSEAPMRRLLADIERPEVRREDLARLLEAVCRVMPQLQIGTIDGLFTRIVRVMGLELAFPHAWNIATDVEADELALAAADRMLRGAEVRDSREQWRRYAQFKPGLRVRAVLVELLEQNRFLLVDVPLPADDPGLDEPLRLSAQETERMLARLAGFETPRTKAGTPYVRWEEALGQIKARLELGATLISLVKESTLLRAAGREGGSFDKLAVPAPLREILGPVVERAREDALRIHEARLPALARLARRYHLLRGNVAYARGAYTFSEVEAAAWAPPESMARADLYFRLDGQIQHLLLDEFQDTSLAQFRFLWPVIREVVGTGRLFFAVGDVKQSIYGWRGADRHLLRRLPGWISDPPVEPRYLPDNWRSSPAVLRSIDTLFENLDRAACFDPEAYAGSTRQKAEAWRKAAAAFIEGYRPHVPRGKNRHLAGRVRLLLIAKAEGEEGDEQADEIAAILRAVQQHLAEDPHREIAILCRRRAWMPEILARLLARGIVASGEGGNPVADSAAVEVVLSMLTWLDHPGHTLAREHIRRSGVAEVFGFAAPMGESVTAGRWTVAIMRRGLADVVADWVRDARFRAAGTVHDQVRAEQLVELARHWDAAGGGRLADFVGQVRSRRVDHPASSQVRVMTIHGAKGLEFEAVILADLEARRGGAESPQLVRAMASPEEPPTVLLLPDRKDAEWLGLEEACRRREQDLFEEELSVLYVALTRAKSFLDVVLPAEANVTPSLAALLREKWGFHDAGEHLIDECPAVAVKKESQPQTVPPDPGIWRRGDAVKIARVQTVPARRESITPSGEEGGGIVNLGQFLQSGNTAALERGTAVHALLSRIEWLDGLPTPEVWAASVPAQEADAAACRAAARELHARLGDPCDPLAAVFNPKPWLDLGRPKGVTRLELWRERRFAAIVGPDLMNGSFDRVVLGLDAAGKKVCAEILDFKTDRLAGEPEREERRRFYQPQLDAYEKALRALTALPAEAIQARLVWING